MAKKRILSSFIIANVVGLNGIVSMLLRYHATIEALAIVIFLVAGDAVLAMFLLLKYWSNEQ